ncbi:retrovirus-related pol polyprotein from transposon TNT 1-94 [Tanacetum coccineum]
MLHSIQTHAKLQDTKAENALTHHNHHLSLASEVDSDPETSLRRIMTCRKIWLLIAMYFKRTLQTYQHNLRTSSNHRHKNRDTTPRYRCGNQIGQFRNQRAVNVVGARETVVDSRITRKRCCCVKQAGEGVLTSSRAIDWLEARYEEIDELDTTHFDNLKRSISNTCAVETGDSNVNPDSPDMCDNDIQDDQNNVECDDESVALANLIANLKLDVDENKDSKAIKERTCNFDQELTECKSILAESSKTLGESNSIRDSCLVALQNKQTEFERFKNVVSNDVRCSLLQSSFDLDEITELQCLYLHKSGSVTVLHKSFRNKLNLHEIAICELKKLIEKCKGKSMETKFDKPSVVRQPNAQRIPKPSVLGKPTPFSDSLMKKIFAKKGFVSNWQIVQLILFIVDSGCTKHMTSNLSLLCNFVEKYLGTVHFGNDQFALILGYGDLVQGNIMINRVYYVEGLNHNLFSVGQFCYAGFGEVAFGILRVLLDPYREKGLPNASPTLAWLWHRRLSHLNFDYINLLSKKDVVIGLPKLKYVKDQLCSSCEVSKAKQSSFKSRLLSSKDAVRFCFNMDLSGPMRVAKHKWKEYIMVSSVDYSDYTGFFSTGTKFLNKTLNAFFKEEGIEHQTSTPRTPEQNGVVERQNRTLVEAARTMLSASKLPLFFLG